MYKQIKKIKAVYFKQIGNKLFVLDGDSSPIYVYDCINFELINKIGENYEGGLYHINDNIVDYTFQGINLNDLEKISLFSNNDFYYNNENKDYFIVNKLIEEFKANQYLISKTDFRIIRKIQYKGGLRLFTHLNNIISSSENDIFFYKDFSLLWQKDIRDFFNKEDSKDNQLRIQEIYAYKDNLIVVSTFGILCLNQQNGELIWKTDSYARTMEIVGNFGYVCTGGSLYRVNLDNGEMYNYGKEYARLSDFEYEGKSYWPSGHRVVFHDGLLWYLVYASGDSFVIAIDPENAEYQWIHKIDTYEKADEIQFHQDKMFISDSGGNLFIYEKI